MSKTVLLLDDDPDFRALVVPELLARDHIVVEARTGAEATAAVERERLDLVIVDGLLPDTDGLSWIGQLREIRPETSVMFVSAYWRDASSFHRLTHDLGVALVVHKPVIPSIFAEQVESLLKPEPLTRSGQQRRFAPMTQALQALRAEYAKSLSGKVRELAHAVHQVRAHPRDDSLLRAAAAQGHRLRGTAGSYGFGAVSDAVARLESVLADLLQLSPSERDNRIGDLEPALSAAFEAVVGLDAESGTERRELTIGRVLVVDADPEWLREVEVQGDQQLIEVMAVSAPAEALRRARSTPPDAAILDSDLDPPLGVLRLIRSLRQIPGCETLPLALVSGQEDRGRSAAVLFGASLVLEKPVPPRLIGGVLGDLMARRATERPRVMLVEDDPAFANRTAAVLRQEGMEVHVAHDALTILDRLGEVRPDLLLLDILLPGVSGYDVCRMLRTSPRWQDLPILFLTVKTGVESRVAAFRAGGDDYLAKPVVDEELLARVKARLERVRLVRERAECDGLTGLLLRRTFLDGLTAMLAEAQRNDQPATLCLLDLDRFKEINDRHGHFVGDRILTGFSRLLLTSLRPEDLRGRWGGDEFVLAFGGERREVIEGVLERLRESFAAMRLGEINEPLALSFSAGVAAFPEDGTTAKELLHRADERMYADKRRVLL
jgi:diguanylate cyclase (GGDEF)-like protein